jgi:hypothetical protein
MINRIAASYLAWKAMTEAMHPERRLQQVTVLGIWRLMLIAMMCFILI